MEFAVGEKTYKVNAKDIAFGDAGDGFVFGGIQSRGNLDFDIFGDVFLKSVYVVCESSSRSFLWHARLRAAVADDGLHFTVNQGETTVGLAQRDD